MWKFKYELIAATFTPFNKRGKLDLSRVSEIVERLISNGIKGFFVAGTTGEGFSMTTRERIQLIERFVEETNKRAKIIAHIGSLCLEDMKKMAKWSQDIGADAISILLPFYYKTSKPDDYVQIFYEISKIAPKIPIFLYHIPSLTGLNINLFSILERLTGKIENFVGVKYSSSDLMELSLLRKTYPELKFYFGVDEMMVHGLLLNVDGFIGSTYNFASKLYMQIIEAFKLCDLQKALEMQNLSLRMVQVLNSYGGLPAFKAVMKLIGLDCGNCRLPLKTLDDSSLSSLKESLENMGIYEFLG